jgi:hypothetical protein
LPTPRLEILKDAVVTPLLVLTDWAAPRLLPLSKNVTVPVGKATAVEPGEFTVMVAVKITVDPCCAGLPVEVTVVVVAALLTVCPPARLPLLVAKLLLPT